jgi:hypothetical protein
MTDIVALDKRLGELNDLIDDLVKERDQIIAARQAYTNEGVKSYDNFDDIVWEEKALTADTNFLSRWLKKRVAGWKDVLVNGKLYNRTNPSSQTPDWLAIGAKGVENVANDFWVFPVGGEVLLSNQAALDQRAREYNGGLRKPLSTWTTRQEGTAMRKAYLETHTAMGAKPENYTKRNPSSLSQFGNE